MLDRKGFRWLLISRCVVSQVVFLAKNPPANAGDIKDAGFIPGSGRSPGGGPGSPLQDSCLENPTERGSWRVQSVGLQRV